MSEFPLLQRWSAAGLRYLTNNIVAHIPSFTLRHSWYRRVLGVSIGRGTSIQMGCYLWFFGPRNLRRAGVELGRNTTVSRGCWLDGRASLRIGDNVSLAPEVAIITTQHSLDLPGFPLEDGPVVIEDHVWIGMRAVVLPGTTIGRGAVVAAGAVAKGIIEPMTVVAGVPARPIRKRPPEGLDYELNYPFPLFE